MEQSLNKLKLSIIVIIKILYFLPNMNLLSMKKTLNTKINIHRNNAYFYNYHHHYHNRKSLLFHVALKISIYINSFKLCINTIITIIKHALKYDKNKHNNYAMY